MPHLGVHDLVSIEVDDGFPWWDSWLAALGDLPESQGGASKLLCRKVDAIDTEGMRPLDEAILGRPGALADTRYGVRIHRDGDALVLEADNPALEWEIWLIALAALRANAAIVHGAAVEKDGVALLFPSWGGVGKTALVTGFVRERGWRLLGDDLSFVRADGTVLSLPKPMVLYPYHRSVFPEVFERGSGPVAPAFLNEALTEAGRRVKPLLRLAPGALHWARQHNPQSVRIAPSQVFGPENIGTSGKLERVVWLERVPGLTQPELIEVAGSLREQVMATTINEFDPRCVRATHILSGLGVLGDGEIYGRWLEILGAAFADRPQHRLHLPTEMPLDEVADAVADQVLPSSAS